MTETAALLVKLKRRLGITDQDELLTDLLTDAQTAALTYTELTDLPTALDGVVIALAAVDYNRLGMEGENSHGEGGVSASMIDGIPKAIRQRMDPFRVAKVG